MTPSLFKPLIALINIDNQNCFASKGGSLYVPGAATSAVRAARFIDHNRDIFNVILSSFDKHGPKHIFYSMWWVDANGHHPHDLETITYGDVLKGKWLPLFDREWSINYVKTLGSFTIWPIHGTANTPESELVPVLARAIHRHAVAHRIDPISIEKGQPKRVEFYGMFGAEVEDPQDSRTRLNTMLIETIANTYDRTYWFGQEAGHCVKRSLEQYIDWCLVHNPQAISKMRYVSDCIDRLPLGPEYNKMIDDSIKSMVQNGMVVIKSTNPLC
jgi:nicotinamidase/pyrazinamidase